MRAVDFIIYLFWDHHCDLKTNGQKVQVLKGAKRANFHIPFTKNGKVRLEEVKQVCNALGIAEPKLKP